MDGSHFDHRLLNREFLLRAALFLTKPKNGSKPSQRFYLRSYGRFEFLCVIFEFLPLCFHVCFRKYRRFFSHTETTSVAIYATTYRYEGTRLWKSRVGASDLEGECCDFLANLADFLAFLGGPTGIRGRDFQSRLP